jgi:hypothetical protein
MEEGRLRSDAQPHVNLDGYPAFAVRCPTISSAPVQQQRRIAAIVFLPPRLRLGLLQPERCERGRRTVYADRLEVDVVMTSMFMRVNAKCAHQERPPLGPTGGYAGPNP